VRLRAHPIVSGDERAEELPDAEPLQQVLREEPRLVGDDGKRYARGMQALETRAHAGEEPRLTAEEIAVTALEAPHEVVFVDAGRTGLRERALHDDVHGAADEARHDLDRQRLE